MVKGQGFRRSTKFTFILLAPLSWFCLHPLANAAAPVRTDQPTPANQEPGAQADVSKKSGDLQNDNVPPMDTGIAYQPPEPAGETRSDRPTTSFPIAVGRGWLSDCSGHRGFDLAVQADEPVLAFGAGKVLSIGKHPAQDGNGSFSFVVLLHGDGKQDTLGASRYFHLARATVHEGDTVQAGQVIGYAGGAEGDFANSVHFEVLNWAPGNRLDYKVSPGQWCDVSPFLPAGSFYKGPRNARTEALVRRQTADLGAAKCAGAPACKSLGLCGYLDGQCAATTEVMCRNSDFCKEAGLCSLRSPQCVVASDRDCFAACTAKGACSASAPDSNGTRKCIPTKAAHCKQAPNCQRFGACGLKGNRCVATSAADCRKSNACRNGGFCALDPTRDTCSFEDPWLAAKCDKVTDTASVEALARCELLSTYRPENGKQSRCDLSGVEWCDCSAENVRILGKQARGAGAHVLVKWTETHSNCYNALNRVAAPSRPAERETTITFERFGKVWRRSGFIR
jgi:murein DD-endopeptidase MepM/ murein hydrolase activator NlpD